MGPNDEDRAMGRLLRGGERASASGRVNKRGEVVLYVAEEEETAIAEARPAALEIASIASTIVFDCNLLHLG